MRFREKPKAAAAPAPAPKAALTFEDLMKSLDRIEREVLRIQKKLGMTVGQG